MASISTLLNVKPKTLSKLSAGILSVAAIAAMAVYAPWNSATAQAPLGQQPADSKPVFFVGNNWDGTVTVIEPSGDFKQVGVINMIPDRKQRMRSIYWNPIKLVAFYYIRNTAGEGNDQFVDDMYSTPDGRSIVASRPSFADVVSINMSTGQINWRFEVDGLRSDHMAVSPDGQQLAVSASTGNVVHVLDINSGKELGKFPTGDKPHENIFFDGGTKILNSSIGDVQTSYDAQWQDYTKGDRYITISDITKDFEVIKTIDLRPALDAAGYPELSNSVRPAVLSPDEKKLYAQVSFFNGIVEYDLTTDKVTRVGQLPGSDTIPEDRKDYVNDSRHHGLSISADGKNLCVAGTMDDYVTIVDTATFTAKNLIPSGKPYWATVTPDGENCLVSESETDSVTVVSFKTGQKVATVPVGNHPQRVRYGYVPANWSGTQ
jgi:YVTN family beta-propeller protein